MTTFEITKKIEQEFFLHGLLIDPVNPSTAMPNHPGFSRKIIWLFICLLCVACNTEPENTIVLVESESFDNWGGWVLDQQSIDQMGSAYLMAHGLGVKVEDAKTTVTFKESGRYKVWVRTRDWSAPWKMEQYKNDTVMRALGFPGKFEVLVDGIALDTVFGTQGNEWHWQDGGIIIISKPTVELSLHDLTGFNGRCDAILFSNDPNFTPPNALIPMTTFRQKLLGTTNAIDKGAYDLVVVGGGIAGITTAISAARHGNTVALVQNRPVLGGNNSSEVRVGLSGLIHQKPYSNIGNLVDEISPVGHWTFWDAQKNPDTERSKKILEVVAKDSIRKIHNAAPKENYEDDKKLNAVLAEKNITLFLNTHMNGVEMEGNKIVSVSAIDLKTSERIKIRGSLFADCTGDGNLGFAAGADFRQGRESQSLTLERLAPAKEDQLLMGSSMQWVSASLEENPPFPKKLTWAVQFNEDTCVPTEKGDWDWETGADRDQATETERIRDYALRIIFGNWAVLKHHSSNEPEFQKYRDLSLQWIAYIAGKRESRRLMGDIILKQQDIEEGRPYEDASVTTTWTIDLHYPKKPKCACDAFMSNADQVEIKPYPIPYRTLYSRNVENLMMAGRNISVTHVALGTTRVQRTTGMMGEVVGMAASICKKHQTTPRGVYENHLPELIELMKNGVPPPTDDPSKLMYYTDKLNRGKIPFGEM
jgi:hypothetical protein